MNEWQTTYAIIHGPSGEILERYLTSFRNAHNRANNREHYICEDRLTVVMVKGDTIVGAIDTRGKLRKTHYVLRKTVWDSPKY